MRKCLGVSVLVEVRGVVHAHRNCAGAAFERTSRRSSSTFKLVRPFSNKRCASLAAVSACLHVHCHLVVVAVAGFLGLGAAAG